MMQIHYVWTLWVAGWVMGMVFDLYNTATGASRWLRWLRPSLDLSFWAASAIAVFYLTYRTDAGRFRIYTIGLLILGYIVYRVTFHQQVVASALTIVRWMQYVVRIVLRWVTAVTVTPVWFVLRISWKILFQFYRLLCFVENLIFHILHFWFKLILWPPVRKKMARTRLVVGFSQHWEGMWQMASNWLKGDSERI